MIDEPITVVIHYVDRSFNPPKCLKITRRMYPQALENLRLEDERIVAFTAIAGGQ
jgi:hypothetical protein